MMAQIVLRRLAGFALAWCASGPVLAADGEKPLAIWTVNVDGSDPRRLVQLEGYDYHRMPRWSHDGRRVVFYAANQNGFAHEVFIVNADGTEAKKVALGDCPDWSPDDQQLSSSAWVAPVFHAEVQNVDGRGRQRLAVGAAPRWSPDGSHMAVVRDGRAVHVLDLAGGDDQLRFAVSPDDALAEACDWSPDGTLLAAFHHPAAVPASRLLLLTTGDPSAEPRVRLKIAGGGLVSFSPDGRRLVFDAAGRLYVVDVAGEKPAQQIPAQRGRNQDADWSPDGKRLVFASNRDGPSRPTAVPAN